MDGVDARADLIITVNGDEINRSRLIFKVLSSTNYSSEAEFKEFEPRLKFETKLKHDWFHLNCIKFFEI